MKKTMLNSGINSVNVLSDSRHSLMVFRKSTIVMVLYFLPIFFVNADFGDRGEFFFRLQFLVYPLLLLAFVSEKKNFAVYAACFLLVITLVSYGFLYVFGDFFPYLKSFLGFFCLFSFYVILNLLIYNYVKDFQSAFFIVLEKYILFSMVALIFSYLIWKVTGQYFLADSGYGYFRPHAFLSEPSALSPFLAFGFVAALLKKNLPIVVLALIGILVSGSIIALIVSLFCFVLLNLLTVSFFVRLIMILIVSVIAVLLYQYIDGYVPSGDGLFDSQVLRLKHALVSFETFGDEGYNPRVNTAVDLYYYSVEHSKVLFGFGPFSDRFLPFSEVAKSASSLPLTLFFNFGVVALFVYLIVFFVELFKVDVRDYSGLLFVCVSLTALINSAQGVLIYQLVFLSYFLQRYQREKNTRT